MSINATLLGQMITFALFVWFTMAFVWPPIIKALTDRKIKIADGLAAAERGEREWQDAKRKGADVLTDARKHAQEIIIEAQKRASMIEQESKAKATEEYKRIINKAQEDMLQLSREARDAIREDVIKLALSGAEKVIAKEIDGSAHHILLKQMVEEL